MLPSEFRTGRGTRGAGHGTRVHIGCAAPNVLATSGSVGPRVPYGFTRGSIGGATEYRKKLGSEQKLTKTLIHSSIFSVDQKHYGRFQEASGRSRGGIPGASWGLQGASGAFWRPPEASWGLLEAFWGLRGAS